MSKLEERVPAKEYVETTDQQGSIIIRLDSIRLARRCGPAQTVLYLDGERSPKTVDTPYREIQRLLGVSKG